MLLRLWCVHINIILASCQFVFFILFFYFVILFLKSNFRTHSNKICQIKYLLFIKIVLVSHNEIFTLLFSVIDISPIRPYLNRPID